LYRACDIFNDCSSGGIAANGWPGWSLTDPACQEAIWAETRKRPVKCGFRTVMGNTGRDKLLREKKAFLKIRRFEN
jgi:hypothetical protein